MNKKLIIWDFDGVIADTEKLWLQTRMEMLNEKFDAGWDFKTTAHFLTGMSDKTKQAVLHDLGFDTDKDFWDEALIRDMRKMAKGFALTKGIEDIFKLTDFDQCIATGGTAAKTEQKIKCVGIEKYFPPERVFTADMVAAGKPEPDLFLLAADVMNYEAANCLVIEDSLSGLFAAQKAKMPAAAFVLYNSESYIDEIKKIGVKNIFDDMSEIKKFILNEK